MLPRIGTDTDSPVVGNYYLVKCAVVDREMDKLYIPCIGEPHSDQQFSVPYTHVHIDGRFFNKGRKGGYEVNKDGKTNGIVQMNRPYQIVRFEYRKMRCVRTTTGILPPPYSKNYFDWYGNYVGKSCAGKKCPHLGTTMLYQADGKTLVCPLHNLIGCKETEKIIPYIHKP